MSHGFESRCMHYLKLFWLSTSVVDIIKSGAQGLKKSTCTKHIILTLTFQQGRSGGLRCTPAEWCLCTPGASRQNCISKCAFCQTLVFLVCFLCLLYFYQATRLALDFVYPVYPHAMPLLPQICFAKLYWLHLCVVCMPAGTTDAGKLKTYSPRMFVLWAVKNHWSHIHIYATTGFV